MARGLGEPRYVISEEFVTSLGAENRALPDEC